MDGGRHDGFISKPYTRTSNNSAQDGLVEYSIEAKPEIKSIFKDAELPTPSFNKLKKNDNKAIDTFKNAIAKAKQSLGDYGASVELKDDYTDINLYLSEDGHERLKEYLSKYDINIDSKIFVDSLIDLNNYIDKEDADITLSEEEINNDIEYYIDSVKEYIDAKKKEFKEEDVNRDEDGKFAKKGSSSNKSKDNDIEITDNDRYEYLANVYARMHGYKDNKLLDAEENAIRKNILSDKEKVKTIDNDIKYSRGLEKSDKDKYNKYKEYKETAEYKEKMKKAINQFEGDTKATAEKLYSENLKAGELVLNKDGELDEAKINKLNIVEKGIHFFTEDCDNRNEKGFTSIKKKVKDLINKSIPKEISLYRHETIYESDERYNFEVGKTIKMDVRSFCNSENAFNSCRALQLWNNAPHKDVIFKIEGEVKSLEIESLSEYTNQKEHLVNGNFVITEIREATLTMPKIITIKVA